MHSDECAELGLDDEPSLGHETGFVFFVPHVDGHLPGGVVGYLYLLSFANFKNITETLSINGRHCLEDKNHTETQNIVLDMTLFKRITFKGGKNGSDN